MYAFRVSAQYIRTSVRVLIRAYSAACYRRRITEINTKEQPAQTKRLKNTAGECRKLSAKLETLLGEISDDRGSRSRTSAIHF